MVQLTYEIRARQQTTLTPRLQQSVKLLQMSTLDFSQELAEAIANNPFLEVEDSVSASAPSGMSSTEIEPTQKPYPAFDSAQAAADAHDGSNDGASPDGASPQDTELARGQEAEIQYCEADQKSANSNYSGDYPQNRDMDRPDADVGQWARSETGLSEALHNNLCGYRLNERDRISVELIIDALDEDGYLRTPLSELTPADNFSPPITPTEWETALHLVQQLAAPGLAARDLSECLSLQLAALSDKTPGKHIALRIATEGLDKLGKCDYSGLIRLLGCSETDVRQACALIRGLDPRPAARYAAVDPSCYVVPDVLVQKAGKLWVAVPNRDAMPRARLDNTYAQLFHGSRYDDRSLMATALQEARWLIRSLEQRNTTIQRVAQAIVARQQTFFDYGEIALRPLMLSEIAEELGMHESTVSRATSNKYLASPRGIHEFKRFFSRELATRSGGTCSAVAVRALIQEMIDQENPEDPLSDVILAQKLACDGVIVARRTVSKYRAQIKYPSAEMRRAL
ncbi:MAG: RNA polymerase factor sigma-54 [Burkholderiaceae bacterium]